MAARSIRISFTLDETDIAYFRGLQREARKNTAVEDQPEVIRKVRKLIDEVRGAKKAPGFVREAVSTLEDLLRILEDEDYGVPKAVAARALTALSYFANPADLVPDHLPGLGFLDDAIMIKLVEDEFKDELWGYRKFRDFREGAEQRHWTPVAKQRQAGPLAAKRREIRAKIEEREARAERGPRRLLRGW
jgi:uncharacterized membrane protein YkvA (DUF1232 family)